MSKLPVKLRTELELVQRESIPIVAGFITRIKANCPNLPSWISAKGVEYYEGLQAGNYMMIERSLSIYNCYAGYMERDEEVKVGASTYTIKYHSYCF